MARPLKILLTNSGRKWIGEVAHCVMLQQMLRARGHQAWIACRRGHELEAYVIKENLPHLTLAFSGSFSPSGDWRDVQEITRFVRENGIDLIHAHRGKDHWVAAAASLRAGVPLVRTRHVVTRVKDHVLNRWLYGKATAAVISVSEAAEQSFGDMLAAIPSHRVILSAVDSVKFSPKHRSEIWRREQLAPAFHGEPLWVGLIGRIQRIKGQTVFLDAARLIAREIPEAHFFIAGRGGVEKREKFEAFAKENGFAGRLRVEGVIENLPEVIASLDIGVVASLGSEASSRVTMEYMASEVPVVATRVGGIPQILTSQNHKSTGLGIIVPPGDSNALACAILELARDPARRSDMAERARWHVNLHHNPDLWAAAIEQVYREVLGVRA